MSLTSENTVEAALAAILGTSGNDNFTGNPGSDSFFGGTGEDIARGLGGSDRLGGGDDDDTLFGGGGDDSLTGAAGDDSLVGGGGDDTANGGDGDDAIFGGLGDDLLRGAAGDDRLLGSEGRDRLIGGSGDDQIYGGTDNDNLFGDSGNDLLVAGAGNDQADGGDGEDDLLGLAGKDQLFGALGDDSLFGGSASDLLFGGADEDLLLGEDGADTLLGDGGDDVMFGGAGDDTAIWNNGDGTDLMVGNAGFDRAVANLADGPGDEVVITDTPQGIDFTRLNLGPFSLDIRETEVLEVNGLAGDDSMAIGGGVVDEIQLDLDGGTDNNANTADLATGDLLDLSELDQGVFVDLDVDFAGIAAPGLGEDGLVRNVEAFPPFGGGTDFSVEADDFENVIGTEFNDVIFGNAQANVLNGGSGNDVMHAFGGSDHYIGGSGIDTALFLQAVASLQADLEAGEVTVARQDGGTDVNQIEGFENLDGGAFDDAIIGDAEVNILSGEGGDDVLTGGLGNDTLIGGTGDDTFFFEGGDSGGAAEVADFEVEGDVFAFDPASFGLEADAQVIFRNVERDGEGLDAGLTGFTQQNADTNVYVLQGAFANAGAAADAIANALNDAGAGQAGDQSGFFIYFNEAQGRNRLFQTEDLDDADAALQQITNLGGTLPPGDQGRAEALAELPEFQAGNFAFGTEDELLF
ncbi:MAG: calcium-binding protein [Pseudomonadota bacterium]